MNAMKCRYCGAVSEETTNPLAICTSCGGSLAPPAQTLDPRRGVDLRQVAKRQRMLLWFVLGLLCYQVVVFGGVAALHPFVSLAIILSYCALQICVVVSVLRLLSALGVHVIWRILWAVLLFSPCINLLLLLIVNRRATRALREAGLRVGLLGVKDDAVLKKFSVHLCKQCGYDLTGNLSGRCPECGVPIEIGGV